MLPVVAGSSSFTIIDDVWNIFSFYVQVSLIIQYQLGCWVSDTTVLSIPVFILVAVGLCLHHRRRVFVRRCLSPLSFSLKTFPAAPQQQLTAAVQPAPAPANESVVLVTYIPPVLEFRMYQQRYRPRTNQPNLWRVDFRMSLIIRLMRWWDLQSSSLLIAHYKKIRNRLIQKLMGRDPMYKGSDRAWV